MLINLRNALMAGKRMPTAKDYVQSGLVAMWDGIENAGWGTHSNNSPIDLIAGIQLSRNDSGTIISDDSFTTPAGTYYYADIPDFKTAVNSKDFTCEIVMSGLRAANNGIFSIAERGLWIYGNGNYNVSTVNIMATAYTQGVNPNFTSDGRFSFAVAGGQSPAVYIGGQTKSASYGSLSSFSVNRVYIGGMNGNNVFSPASKTFYCVRLYERTLSAQEIAANYAIDKERFGLPDAT